MKILLVNKYFYLRGGAEKSFFETASLLESKHHKIIYLSMLHPRNLSSEYQKYFVSNVDYERGGVKNKIDASLKILYSFEAKRKIEELIKDTKPDIVHLNNICHQISPSILHVIKKHNLPAVMSLRDYKLTCASYSMLSKGKVCEACKNRNYYHCFLKGCVKNSKMKSLLNTIEMYLHHNILHIYNLVDYFISPSLFLKNKTEEMGFKGKIYHLPNFVRIENIKSNSAPVDDSIAYVGRLSEEKGLSTLLEAVKGLNIKLKIIGEGPLKEELVNKVQKNNITNIVFLGYMTGNELAEEIRKALAVVVPSKWYENNPRSVIEAFAFGKPVIGSRIGGIPELVKDNVNGLTFEPENAAELRLKIEYMRNNPDKAAEMGQNARAFVKLEISPEKHYGTLMEIYNKAIERHACP